MLLNKYPEIISFEVDGEPLEAYVMFIAPKYIQTGDDGGETFVVLCYDKDDNIYEVFLNECKIVKARDERKNFIRRRTFKAGARKRRESDDRRDIHPQHQENDTEERDGGALWGGNDREAY